MSRWNHVICRPCWDEHNHGRDPIVLVPAVPEPCCFCGRSTMAGIYIRHDPAALRCAGVHRDAN